MTIDLAGFRAGRPLGGGATGKGQLAVTATAVAAVAAAAIVLLDPTTGIDLSAQVAHVNFWARHGSAVLNFGWYGGFSPDGYSVLTPRSWRRWAEA